MRKEQERGAILLAVIVGAAVASSLNLTELLPLTELPRKRDPTRAARANPSHTTAARQPRAHSFQARLEEVTRWARGTHRSQELVRLARGWAHEDPSATLRWAESQCAEEDPAWSIDWERVVHEVIAAWTQAAPEEAATVAGNIRHEELRRSALHALAVYWPSQQPREAAAWFANLRPKAGLDGVLGIVIHELASHDPDAGLTLVPAIGDPALQIGWLTQLQQAHARDVTPLTPPRGSH